MKESAKESRREYMRAYMKKWRAKNKDKIKIYNDRYWEKKANKQLEILKTESEAI